ncbi:DUF6345 domain-containing protein [Paracoccus sp. (in: a-proteobacteria)]|uniref:DUF6345 domain-containing protein n=1 Tax=Paracoccus sp. TaxID=267 RepID=UPI00321FA831
MEDLARRLHQAPSPLPQQELRMPDPAEHGAEDEAMARLYGACSVETYRAAGALHAAHRDAGGFLDAVDGHATPAFWRRDGAVKSWIYDRGQVAHDADRDMDSVRVFYHAGHGRMGGDGVFQLPMGALWAGNDACLGAERMRLGSGALRYLFWSASQSLRLGAGFSPPRSWAAVNHGLRMLFGFDSVCWDSGRHGANFWRHWQMGKTLSQAWLDGAWDVAHDQSPVVCACGESRDAALATLFSERRFRQVRASGEWWAWRWHAPAALFRREPLLVEPPASFASARLVPVAEDDALAREVLARLGLDPGQLVRDAHGALSLQRGPVHFLRRADGGILLEFAPDRPGARGRLPLQRRALVSRARGALRRHGFIARDMDLVFDRVSLAMSATARRRQMHEPPDERLDAVIVQFRQVIDGIAVLDADAGAVRLTMDPEGAVLRIESSLRRVARLLPARAYCGGQPADPVLGPGAVTVPCAAPPPVSLLLARHSARLMRDLAARGAAPLGLGVLPGTTEIGYGIRSNTARLVARQGIEIECERGFRKRYWIQSDLGD